jgi:hypothetical protein
VNLYRIELADLNIVDYVEAETMEAALALWEKKRIASFCVVSTRGAMREDGTAPTPTPTPTKPGHAVGCVDGLCAPACRAPEKGGEF